MGAIGNPSPDGNKHLDVIIVRVEINTNLESTSILYI